MSRFELAEEPMNLKADWLRFSLRNKKKNEEKLSEPQRSVWHIKYTNIWITGVGGGEERKNILRNNGQKLAKFDKNIMLHIQEA